MQIESKKEMPLLQKYRTKHIGIHTIKCTGARRDIAECGTTNRAATVNRKYCAMEPSRRERDGRERAVAT